MNGKQLTFIDILSVASFLIALENLDENMTQNDKQELQSDLVNKSNSILKEIHSHLEEQDRKLDAIIKRLGELQ
jgi:hypothetical protein